MTRVVVTARAASAIALRLFAVATAIVYVAMALHNVFVLIACTCAMHALRRQKPLCLRVCVHLFVHVQDDDNV
jgi:hypothetical protein